MLLKWLPWRYIVRQAAHAHGFLDPLAIMGRLQNFAQPSEVTEPIELLRAGMIFHARGLLNTRAIQNNLDWVWPYWVERQFNPRDPSFIPRGFSFSHVNLSHRNWTAVGLPDCPYMPIVDPSGLVTPFYDGWSLDAWVLDDQGESLLPSKLKEGKEIFQRWVAGIDSLAVETRVEKGEFALESRVDVVHSHGEPFCRVDYRARSRKRGWLTVSLRPYNPEGVSFVKSIAYNPGKGVWLVNGQACVRFGQPMERHAVAQYRQGDVLLQLPNPPRNRYSVECPVEMATAAALFPVEPGGEAHLVVHVKLAKDKETAGVFPHRRGYRPWKDALAGACALKTPDGRFNGLYEAALRSLVLHSPEEVYPGPYTYKRFWFRDAAFMIHALLGVNLVGRARRALEGFPHKQSVTGYFLSQEGEWDSNGEALWIMHRYCEMTGRAPEAAWRDSITAAAQWICRKRQRHAADPMVRGLFPAGFSAEHLGPNDYYYWDDFWGVAGLRAAAAMLRRLGRGKDARRFEAEAGSFLRAIDSSIAKAQEQPHLKGAIPAAPRRRMDSGSVGSLVAGYPLALYAEADPRLLATARHLHKASLVRGGFFQDMIHSGINAYLTLHLAQVLLRSGDARFFGLVEKVAEFASPTGQWPEAIHPHTLGGCMGDGHHVWAAAEWALMMRSLFLREEADRLVLAPGIPRKWLDKGVPMHFGPTPTRFGTVTVRVEPENGRCRVAWDADWHAAAPEIEVRLQGAPMAAHPPGSAGEAMVPLKGS